MLYNRPPSLSHLKTFACLCYATAVSPKQKFDLRARQWIFIGYPLNKKAYKLFDIDAYTLLEVEMSSSMKVFSHSANRPRCNPHLHYKVFCPLLSLTYPLLSNIHSINLLLLLITIHLNLHQTNNLLLLLVTMHLNLHQTNLLLLLVIMHLNLQQTNLPLPCQEV